MVVKPETPDRRRCYRCGEFGHVKARCPEAVPCKSCNEYGHRRPECPVVTPVVSHEGRCWMCIWHDGSVEASAAPQQLGPCMHTRAQQQQQQQLCKGARPRLVRTNDPKVPDSVEDDRRVVVVKCSEVMLHRFQIRKLQVE